MYSSITAFRCASVAVSKLFSPGTTSITKARGSSTQPYTCATGMPSASSSSWKRISCSSGKSGAASVRSPRTITVDCSPSRSTSTNHTGRQRACLRMPVTSAPRCSRHQSVSSCSVSIHVVHVTPRELAPDDLLHDLGGAAVDRGDAGVGVGAGDRVLEHVAVAAVQLHAPVDDALLQLGAPPLRLGGFLGGELAGVERARRSGRRTPGAMSISVRISASSNRRVLERRRSAGRTRCAPSRSRGSSRARPRRRRRRAPAIDSRSCGRLSTRCAKPLPSSPSRLATGTCTSVKNSSAVSWACRPTLSRLRPRSKPSMPRSSTSRLMPVWRCVGSVFDRGDHEVGVDAVGDERLRAVDDVVVAVADRRRAHRREVGADAGLGHGDGGDQLARRDAGQPARASARRWRSERK